MTTLPYEQFVESKVIRAKPAGFRPDRSNPKLFKFQDAIVDLACRRGKSAIFADCGLGKTAMQLEWAQQVARCASVELGPPSSVLILAPLAVARQTVGEGLKFGVDVQLCRDGSDVRPGVNITNYDKLHLFDPKAFDGIVLDESSVLKDYTSATRTQIVDAFRDTPFKLACTATPSPNDYVELGNHAEFLGVMTRTEMLATFFVHDGGSTQDWRLKGHAEEAFWRWVCSWAVMLRKPSDLGFSDEGYTLPPLQMEQVRVSVDGTAQAGMLFAMEARTLEERREARKASLKERVAAAAKLANESTEPWLIWCDLNDEGDALEAAIPDAVQVAGSDSAEFKEERMLGFTSGKYRVLVSKSSICGWGMNWQHCPNVAFVGVSDSFEKFYQAVRRVYRFGQTRSVRCVLVASEREGSVVTNLERKEADAARMAEAMVANMADFTKSDLLRTERQIDTYQRDVASGEGWTAHLGDCVEVLREQPDNSVGYTVTSVPFASLYTYSNSPRDFGNCSNHGTFFEQMRYLVAELLRVTMPGRNVSVHCMLLPTSKVRDGVIGLTDFRGDLVRLFREAGWIYHSEVCIWKDPVTAMQRTKALGLLHKQIKKDSSMSRQGIPDYLVTFRKPGENPEPIRHTDADFPVKEWQALASPCWMDIKPSDTLQFRSAREHKDERHICPLQLTVIRRGLRLWSNPGDVVLDPFGGIGSTGVVALEMGRRSLSAELKPSYWRQSCANLRIASKSGRGQRALFADLEPVELELPEPEDMHGAADEFGGEDYPSSEVG